MAVTRFLAGGIVLSVLVACSAGETVAQVIPSRAQTVAENSRPRLASPGEGEAIVQAAWELRRGLLPKPDCSHFVHAVYERAGFPYEFAHSADLFEGIDSFRRVRTPQAGDLIVWDGHVGIVIDPIEHSFYSSVIKGFAIESYRSSYWAGRGTPRFYRYLVHDVRTTPAVARAVPPASLPARPKLPHTDGARSFAESAPERPHDLRATPAVARAVQPASLPARSTLPHTDVARSLAESVPERPNESSFATLVHESRNLESSPESRNLESRNLDAQPTPATDNENEIETRDAVLISSHEKPSKIEIQNAILRAVDSRGRRVLPTLRLESEPLVVIASAFKVVDLKIKNNAGWVDVEVKEDASFHLGNADTFPVVDGLRISVTRQEQGWVLFMPREPVFLCGRLARELVARRVATLSHAPGNHREVLRRLEQILERPSARGAGDLAASWR